MHIPGIWSEFCKAHIGLSESLVHVWQEDNAEQHMLCDHGNQGQPAAG